MHQSARVRADPRPGVQPGPNSSYRADRPRCNSVRRFSAHDRGRRPQSVTSSRTRSVPPSSPPTDCLSIVCITCRPFFLRVSSITYNDDLRRVERSPSCCLSGSRIGRMASCCARLRDSAGSWCSSNNCSLPSRLVADVEIIAFRERAQRSAGRRGKTHAGSVGFGSASSETAPSLATAPGTCRRRGRARELAIDRPGNGAPAERPTRSTIVAGRSRRLTTSDHRLRRRRVRRQDEHERHADLRAVEALAVLEQSVLAQFFAVIGRDDHQGPIELAALAAVWRAANPGSRRDGRGSCRTSRGRGPRYFGLNLRLSITFQSCTSSVKSSSVRGPLPEAERRSFGEDVRRMGIEVIEECEEGTARLLTSG